MDKLMNQRNLVIEHGIACEIIGKFLWAESKTNMERNILASLGFRWSKSKERWYWTYIPFNKKTNKVYSLDDLRQIYNKSSLIVR